MATRPQIILFGDSITQGSFDTCGWGASVANRYARKADVILRGFSGYNTRWALYLLNKIVPRASSNPPLFVTVFFGANDAALPDKASKSQHVPLPEYKENLRKIVAHLKVAKVQHIILITPPPLDTKGWQEYCRVTYGETAENQPGRTNETTGQYAEACESVALETGVKALNIWTIFQEKPNWKEAFFSDGLHFSPEGNEKMFQELVKVLDDPSLVPSLKCETMPLDYPEWNVVTWENPSETFGPMDN